MFLIFFLILISLFSRIVYLVILGCLIQRGGLNIRGGRNISQYIISGGGVLISGGGGNISQYYIISGGNMSQYIISGAGGGGVWGGVGTSKYLICGSRSNLMPSKNY